MSATSQTPMHGKDTETPASILQEDGREIRKLYDAMRKGKAKLVGPNGEARVLPGSLYEFLVELIALLNEGKCVSIIQHQAQLTTVEASSMLGVSRQFLVGLLEKGEIPYHMVGTHRRIYAHHVMQFKAKRDQARRKTLSQLVEAEVAEGLYSRVPSDED